MSNIITLFAATRLMPILAARVDKRNKCVLLSGLHTRKKKDYYIEYYIKIKRTQRIEFIYEILSIFGGAVDALRLT